MQKRLVGQAVKTSASHAENMGSIPVRVTKKISRTNVLLFLFSLVTRTWVSNPARKECLVIDTAKQGDKPKLSPIASLSALWVRITASPSPVESLQGEADSRARNLALWVLPLAPTNSIHSNIFLPFHTLSGTDDSATASIYSALRRRGGACYNICMSGGASRR